MPARLHFLRTTEHIFDPNARTARHGHLVVFDGDRQIEPATEFLGTELVLLATPDVGHTRCEVQHRHKPESARDMHRGWHVRYLRHAGHSQRTEYPAVVVQVGVHSIHRPISKHAAESSSRWMIAPRRLLETKVVTDNEAYNVKS